MSLCIPRPTQFVRYTQTTARSHQDIIVIFCHSQRCLLPCLCNLVMSFGRSTRCHFRSVILTTFSTLGVIFWPSYATLWCHSDVPRNIADTTYPISWAHYCAQLESLVVRTRSSVIRTFRVVSLSPRFWPRVRCFAPIRILSLALSHDNRSQLETARSL